MKRILATAFTVLLTLSLSAQPGIDSVTTEANKFSSTVDGINKLLAFASSLRSGNLDNYLAVNTIAAEKAGSIKNDTLLCKALINIAIANNEMSNSEEASAALAKANLLAEKTNHRTLLMKIAGTTGSTYYINKQYPKALEYYQKALDLTRETGNKRSQITAIGNIAAVYYDMAQLDPTYLNYTKHYAHQSFELARELNDSNQLINQSCNLALILSDLKKTDSARYYLSYARTMIGEDDYDNLTVYFSNMGRVSWEEKKYAEAITYYEKTIGYGKKYNSPEWVFESNLMISEIYEEQQKPGLALLHYKKYISLRDSLINQENFAKAADIQNKYQREKKDKELLQKDIALKNSTARRNRTFVLLIGSLTILGLLGFFSFALLKNIKARKKAYSQLEEKSIQIQEQAVELSKQARLIAKFQSQMNPHFVFNALHNIQGLVISGKNQKATSQIQSLAQLMRKTFANAEKDDIPLEEEISYLQKYIDFERSAFDNKLEFDVQTDGEMENVLIPPMMIQPFVENAIKHAELKKIENPYIKVLIEIENNLLSISVRDNGVGLRKQNIAPDMLSHSMSVIKTRIQLLFQEKSKPIDENIFTVTTVPEMEAGTMIKFFLPLNYAY